MNDKGQVDKTWKNFPDDELPAGHRRGERVKGVGKWAHLKKIMDDTSATPLDDAFSGETELPAIPDIGYIRWKSRIQGRGRWDSRNDIFRCIVLCPRCGEDSCNRRMWYAIDGHMDHLCRHCYRPSGDKGPDGD